MHERFRFGWRGIAAGVVLLAGLAIATSAGANVETHTRFLEFDQRGGILAYELTVRNVGSLPVGNVVLSSLPECLEGSLAVMDLAKEEQVSRRFTFQMPEGKLIFQPRFQLAFNDNEGERHRIASRQSPLILSADFAEVELSQGRVVLKLELMNPGEESLLFLELWSENPELLQGRVKLGDLATGKSLSRRFEYSLPVGEVLFNPTLHVSFHAFEADGTRIHRNFYTILQPRLDRVEEALAARGSH